MEENSSMYSPRIVFWELTGRCNLNCIHCRASSDLEMAKNELTTEEAFSLIDDLSAYPGMILILTGGEPLLREDIYEIARYGTEKGLRIALAPNGTLVDDASAKKMKESGIKRVSISIDGATEEVHDAFRRQKGAFKASMNAISVLKENGIEFQVNSSFTERNIDGLEGLYRLVLGLGASAWHIFMIVPTGRGEELFEELIDAEKYEEVLNWVYDRQKDGKIHIRLTCAPHFFRVMVQRSAGDGTKPLKGLSRINAMTKGCMAGQTCTFISRKGDIYPCGYLPLKAGSIRETPFSDIWENSTLFSELRDFSQYKGRCGSCRYLKLCGGCRARAYALTGDALDEEPYCKYMG